MTFFIDYLVPIMYNLDHPALIEEWKLDLDAAPFENNINQDLKIPSIKIVININNKLKTSQQA